MFCLPACSSGSDGIVTTSSVVEPTIEGVCSKYDALSCGFGNCVPAFQGIEQQCMAAHAQEFQAFLDCLASVTISCSSQGPVVMGCVAELNAIEPCNG